MCAGWCGAGWFSNTDLTELLDPPLTVIRQPAFEMVEIAMNLLLQLIESKRPVTDFETKILSTELLVRDSTRRNRTGVKEIPDRFFHYFSLRFLFWRSGVQPLYLHSAD